MRNLVGADLLRVPEWLDRTLDVDDMADVNFTVRYWQWVMVYLVF